LGYFDCDDFNITEEIRDTFYSFVAPTLNINELHIMEFRTKDLEGALLVNLFSYKNRY
jgi:hypothetical protein